MYIILFILICLYVYVLYKDYKEMKTLENEDLIKFMNRSFIRGFYFNTLIWLMTITLICIVYDKV